MSSTDRSTSIQPITSVQNLSQAPVDDMSILSGNDQLQRIVNSNEDTEQDEGINDEDQIDDDEEFHDEPQLDDDHEEQIIPVSSTNNNISIQNTTVVSQIDSNLHELLEGDISNMFLKVSPLILAGATYQSDTEDPHYSVITCHFFTDFIETETACQWQICNKKPLTCQILVHNKHYLDQRVVVKRVYQTCECHPVNSSKVPFIERLVRDYFDKVQISMETLLLSRAILNPQLRLQYFLEIIPRCKRIQYEEMLADTSDDNLLNDFVENEYVDNNRKIADKLELIRAPRENSLNSTKHYDLLNFKNLPTLSDGYLVQFCKYFEYRLRNLNSLCVMCGKRTFDANDKRTSKPTICDDYECFSNAMDSKFRNDPLPPSIFSIEIADFLLLLVYAAIHSSRHQLILDPYPKLINPYNTATTLIDQNGDKMANIEILKKIINDIMTMKSITQYEVDRISLRSTLELKHPWAFSFFHWLMGTNRYHFSLIPEEHQLKSIQTKYQYFIKHEDIVKHVNFKKLRNEKGSIFAFHGSPQENWHSILRSGLQIGKGGYLLNGAAYGAGIYVSPSFQFSSSYVRSHRSYDHTESMHHTYDYTQEIPPLDKRNWSCMALCEIINSPDVYKKHVNDIWTIQDPNLICTRFIFFFPTGLPQSTLRVDSEQEASSIRQLIHTLNNIAC